MTADSGAELGADGVREQAGERRLAGARRAPQQQAREVAARDRPAERAALADEVGLADELVERPRAHARGERLPLGRWTEQGLGTGARWMCAGWAWADGSPRRSADLEHPGDVDRDVQHEQHDQEQDRDAEDVLEVARDVGVLAGVVEGRDRRGRDLAGGRVPAPASGGGRSRRRAPRRPAAPRAPRRARARRR